MSVTFEIDPSTSMVENENIALAHYLKDHYASCKLPLFELLRQQKSQVIRAKECEICAPDSQEYRGSI
jgi:hypothetical protein